MSRALSLKLFAAAAGLLAGLVPGIVFAQKQAAVDKGFLREFCIDCHDGSEPATSFRLDRLTDASLDQNRESWEKVVRKLELREMPPAGSSRPTEQRSGKAIAELSGTLDALAASKPN